jgi:ferredoxin
MKGNVVCFARFLFSIRYEEEIMKVSIDAELCTGCGACADDVPDMFEMGDEIAEVKQADVPADLESAVSQAAEDCPAEAIIVE